MNLSDKNIVVVGLGRTGIAAARFLAASGARVSITDARPAEAFGNHIRELEQLGVQLDLGGHDEQRFKGADLIVISPGVPHTIAPVQSAADMGIPVIGEVELAYRFIQTPIVAITGTNGKTTTTELTGKMLEASGKKVFVGGNIGKPLISYVGGKDKADVIVAEISSFQTDTMIDFTPRVGVLLNLAEDHMDRYPDFSAYANSKARLFKNQGPEDIAVYNTGDPFVRELCAGVNGLQYGFCRLADSAEATTAASALVAKDHIRITIPGSAAERIDLARTGLIGQHNHENIAAAALAALAAGASMGDIQSAVDRFKGLPHRMELVGTVEGVSYINDSKGTNMEAVIRALHCFDAPVVLIMGGLNKGNDFSRMADVVRQHVKKLVVIGQAADEIRNSLADACVGGCRRAGSMADAVQQSAAIATAGDTVLLSPGCASFDMYDNYGQRGDDFRQQVTGLASS
ncbi:MAG: UDP-N-acetylmuramoyl-L-alanine--D-glutamate ligase [Desulfobacteraceae bacterium]|nr:UDP-N-acetylmuramoyl-L-alanine--D-glutamate ligase [Desulfobacteraceae bacterium]